jgi:hypothetical protein
VAERRVDALEPHVLYVRLPRLILRPAEQPQVPLFRVRPCTSGGSVMTVQTSLQHIHGAAVDLVGSRSNSSLVG